MYVHSICTSGEKKTRFSTGGSATHTTSADLFKNF